MTPAHWKLLIVGVIIAVYAVALVASNRYLKTFFWRVFFCLTPLVIAALIVGNAWQHYESGEPGGFKLGVDLVGGTILVYELDMNKLSEEARKNPHELADLLAIRLKRRIDPNDLKNVTIRPVSNGQRVEIILPTGGAHQAQIEQEDWTKLLDEVRAHWPPLKDADLSKIQYGEVQKLVRVISDTINAKKEPNAKVPDTAEIEKFVREHYNLGERKNFTEAEIQEVKDEIREVGSLEFRILANERDDRAAIDAAREYINSGKHKAELEKAARDGLPPPPPTQPDGSRIFHGDKGDYSYSWVELGMEERRDLQLSNDLRESQNWKIAEQARQSDQTFSLPNRDPDEEDPGTLYYSRVCQNVNLSESQRKTKEFEYFVLVRDPGLNPQTGQLEKITGDHLKNVTAGTDQHGIKPAVHFSFDSTGAALFADVTTLNRPSGEGRVKFYRRLAIILDGYVVSAPRLNQPINGGQGEISGSFTPKKVQQLVSNLKSGALPATIKPDPVSENTMGATLGSDTIAKGTRAVGLAFAAILVFMLVYYRFSGLVACIALLANLLLTVAFMVAVNATFTLPGLAGLVLMLGMAVDANVLIYERLREERDRGASLGLAIRNGYDRAFPTIIDTHLSSIFTAIVLYAVGNDQLKGFGVSLTLGLIISLFTSLYMTRLLFDVWLSRNWLHKLSMFRLFTRPNIDFMRIRYYWFTATIVLTIIGIVVFILRVPQDLNIDFVGGTAYGGQLEKPMDITQLRSLLSERGHEVPGKQQDNRLLVVGVKELAVGQENKYAVTYKNPDGTETTRTIKLPKEANGATAPEREKDVAQRASQLEDWSVELIFPTSETTGGGDKTRYFTIRTREKAPDLVETVVGRLLGDNLKRVTMGKPELQKDGKEAILTFSDPISLGQIEPLLQSAFQKEKMAEKFTLRGEDETSNGRYKWAVVELTNPPKSPEERDRLSAALTAVSKEFGPPIPPDRLENFDQVLAKETQARAMYAILASWGAILLYLWFRFGSWTFGLAAVLCLIHDLFFTMGIIAFCHYIYIYLPGLANALLIEDFKIDLPAVAALLTLVGYSTNDTIVVFDRIREVRGKNPELSPQMINDSVNQTLSRTLLTSFATWLVVIVLYIFGGEGVHLFAFCMVIGVIVGTYSSIYIASPLLLIFGEGVRKQPGRERQPVTAAAGATTV